MVAYLLGAVSSFIAPAKDGVVWGGAAHTGLRVDCQHTSLVDLHQLFGNNGRLPGQGVIIPRQPGHLQNMTLVIHKS